MLSRRPCRPSVSSAFLPPYFTVIVMIGVMMMTIPSANAYANWLKCYVDLDDTEVVMNKKLLSHEDADHIVELQVQRLDDDGDGKDDPDGDYYTSDIVYPSGKTTTWKVKVRPPAELKGANMQFVVEAESVYNDGGGTSEDGAIFTYPKMCKGRRSFGRNYNEGVTLEIDGNADSVEIWAAWAIGYGQVSLTPRLVFLKGAEEGEDGEEEL